MTSGLLACLIDMLGERMATALNDTVIYDSNSPVQPNGYLTTSTGSKFQTSTGNLLVYVEKF